MRWPRPYNDEDADQLVKAAEQLNEEAPSSVELETAILRKLAYTAGGDLSPMAALFGGIVGQEALKAISGKFHPMFQFFYFDSEESLPEEKLKEEDCKPQVSFSFPPSCFAPDFMGGCGSVQSLWQQ